MKQQNHRPHPQADTHTHRQAAILSLLVALAILLIALVACTTSHDEPLPPQGTNPLAGVVTTLMGPKPSLGSTAGTRTGTTTRTSPTDDGAWQTGDVIRATITFYTDAEGTAPSASAPVIQTLTYIAAAPGTTGGGRWESAPVPIAPDARSMTATYQYLPTADPMTATSEQIACHVSQARGTAITPDAPDTPITPDADGKLLIPIANVSGTLSLSVDFKRTSALVSVLIQPGQAVVLTTKYSQSPPAPLRATAHTPTMPTTPPPRVKPPPTSTSRRPMHPMHPPSPPPTNSPPPPSPCASTPGCTPTPPPP